MTHTQQSPSTYLREEARNEQAQNKRREKREKKEREAKDKHIQKLKAQGLSKIVNDQLGIAREHQKSNKKKLPASRRKRKQLRNA